MKIEHQQLSYLKQKIFKVKPAGQEKIIEFLLIDFEELILKYEDFSRFSIYF